MPDDLTSALDEIRERAAAMKSSAHGYVARGERLPGGPCGEWLIANLAAAVDVPLLLAAIERVLELHHPVEPGAGAQCKGCATHVTFTRWPCKTWPREEGSERG